MCACIVCVRTKGDKQVEEDGTGRQKWIDEEEEDELVEEWWRKKM